MNSRITIVPDLCDGKPTIRGMRITVKTILEYLAAGESIKNILKAYPDLQKADITACIEFAAEMADHGIKVFRTAS
jgi:uncharacterized protein (DUF433 family)